MYVACIGTYIAGVGSLKIFLSLFHEENQSVLEKALITFHHLGQVEKFYTDYLV